jgi:hypothetical protein
VDGTGVANKCIFTINKHKKARLREVYVLFYLISRIGPVFSQKCYLLDFSLIFMYGFFDFWRFLKIQKVDSA